MPKVGVEPTQADLENRLPFRRHSGSLKVRLGVAPSARALQARPFTRSVADRVDADGIRTRVPRLKAGHPAAGRRRRMAQVRVALTTLRVSGGCSTVELLDRVLVDLRPHEQADRLGVGHVRRQREALDAGDDPDAAIELDLLSLEPPEIDARVIVRVSHEDLTASFDHELVPDDDLHGLHSNGPTGTCALLCRVRTGCVAVYALDPKLDALWIEHRPAR